MRVAIYTRVSTDEQTTANQVLRLKEYASRMDWEYDVFEETMTTRKTRPIKNNLLMALKHKEYDGVLVYKLDRWARSLQELITDINELECRGVRFLSYSDNIDFSSAAGKLQFQILGAFAEFERNLISERTKEGMRRAKAWGKHVGRPRKVRK